MWNQPKREKYVAGIEQKGVAGLKSSLTLDMEKHSMEFALLVLGLGLVHYFPTMIPFLHFGMVVSTLYQCTLEVCNLFFFHFDFTGIKLRDFQSLKQDLGPLSCYRL